MKPSNIIIITGLSGSGKSSALDSFEDTGFFCVDNMPVALLPKFFELSAADIHGKSGLVFVMDLREKGFLSKYSLIFKDLKQKGFKFEIIFFEADEEILLQRYKESRRQHPLSQGNNLITGIREEKRQLEILKNDADIVINTSHYNIHKLKSVIINIAKKRTKVIQMRINILSFGFKYEMPQESDLLIDVRFLINPYFVPELKKLNGESKKISDYILNNSETEQFIEKYLNLLDYLIPLYKNEGKSYLTIAVGCTGGKHRSVTIARTIYRHIKKYEKNIELFHRDIDR